MKQHIHSFVIMSAVAILFVPGGGGGLLTNGSFETGDLTGWLDPFAGGGSAIVDAPGVGAQNGDFAARLELASGVGELRQTFPASPGEEYNMNGWILTESALPVGPSFGLFKIVFRDENGADLEVIDIEIGGQDPAFPGVESGSS